MNKTIYISIAIIVCILFANYNFERRNQKLTILEDRIMEELKAGMPAIVYNIPSDLCDSIELIDNHGNKTIANCKEMYRIAYSYGWIEYWSLYKAKKTILDDDKTEPEILPEYGLQTKARLAGFKACRNQILMMKKQ